MAQAIVGLVNIFGGQDLGIGRIVLTAKNQVETVNGYAFSDVLLGNRHQRIRRR